MIPLTPQESQQIQWSVDEQIAAVSGDAEVIAKVSKQLRSLGITSSLSENKTIVISREDFDKLKAYNSGISIPDSTRSQLVAGVQKSQTQGFTREELSALVNDTSRLEKFISEGGDVNNTTDQFGDTLLHVAVLYGAFKAIDVLLKAGADINRRDYQGETPLYCAVKFGAKEEAVKALIDRGADPDEAYYVAVKKGNQTAMGALEKHVDKNRALVFAASEGNTEVIDALVEQGVDIVSVGKMAKESTNDTTKANLFYALNKAVYLAAKKLYSQSSSLSQPLQDLVRELQESKVDLSGALWEAAKAKDAPIIRMLQVNRVQLSASALKSYLTSESEDAQFLLAHIIGEEGILRDVVSEDLETAKIFVSRVKVDLTQVMRRVISQYAFGFHLARDSYKSEVRIAELARKLMEDIDRIEDLGPVDIDRAIELVMESAEQGNELAIAELRRAKADVNRGLCTAVKKNDAAGIQSLKDRGADLNTALLIAVESFDAATVVGLCTLGADPKNVMDSEGMPVLYVAAERGDSKMIKELIARGATVTVPESLDKFVSSGTPLALDALVRAGVKPFNKEDPDGIILLARAFRDNPTMVDPLIQARWANLEALLVDVVSKEDIMRMVPLSSVLAKKPDLDKALLIAVESFDAATVAGICKLGAKQPDGGLLLVLVAKRGDSEMIKTLVAHGYKAHVQDCLDWIAAYGSPSHLETLVRAGVRPDVEDDLDKESLLEVAYKYNSKMVIPLIQAGWGNLEALLVKGVLQESREMSPSVSLYHLS